MRGADLARVAQIERASFASPWSREQFENELFHNRWSVDRVIELDGRVVGYSVVWEVAGERSINNVAVDPACRRGGLGRRLVRDALDRARESGCHRVTLEVRPSNVAARKLYESMGFREVGRRPGYYRVEAEDAIVMAVSLDAEAGPADPIGSRAGTPYNEPAE
jgi:ribosomal-protein-alanine N-acetyltransferase